MSNYEKDECEKYVGLIKSIARKYVYSGLSMEDLVQEGMIGLLEAKERFDESKGAAFSTYATFWIKKRIIESINKEVKETNKRVEYNDSIDQKRKTSDNNEYPDDEKCIVIPEEFPAEEREVLDLHFNQGKTLSEMAAIKGLSRERIRQIKQKGLRRLKSKVDPE